MPSQRDSFADPADLGVHLVNVVALPVLARGFHDLVRGLRRDPDLARDLTTRGEDAVLGSTGASGSLLRKANAELVTPAERDAERAMREAVLRHHPEHTIIGEELGHRPGGRLRWVFDPIDGTGAMVRNALAIAFDLDLGATPPSFGITAALVDDQTPVLGIVTELRPRVDTLVRAHTWVSSSAGLTTCDGRKVVPAQPPTSLAGATLATTVPEVMFNTPERWSGYQALLDATRGCLTGQNCVGFMRLLEPAGGVHVVYEADLAYHDAAALVPIVEGAGIRITDDRGRALSFGESEIGCEFRLLAATPGLHGQALDRVLGGVDAARSRFQHQGTVHDGYAQKFATDRDPGDHS